VKKILFSLVLIVLTVFASPIYAAEGILVDRTSAQIAADRISPRHFSMIVTGSGKLIIKPGAVFTEGDDTEGMQLPYLLDHPKPISYPRWAVSEGLQGKSIVALDIHADGTVGLSQVMQSTGYDVLDQEALRAAQSWKFHPAMKDGKPVRTCIQVPISFRLKDE